MGNQHITSGTILIDTSGSTLVESGGGTIILDIDAAVFSLAPGPGDAIELNGGPYTVTIRGEAYSDTDDGIDLVSIGNLFHSTITVGVNGTVYGASNGVEAAHGTDVINSGKISGDFVGVFEGGAGDFTIKNTATGEIRGGSGVGSKGIFITNFGTHSISNGGSISGDPVLGSAIQSSVGIENVVNWGTITGAVSLGNGNDVFTNFKKIGAVVKDGAVFGDIRPGDGDDKFFGGGNTEHIFDGNGSDIVKLSGGDDNYIALGASGSDGTDTIAGGLGVDFYQVGGGGSIRINLDSVAHANAVFIAANTAKGNDISGGFVEKDKITGFENALGGNGDNIIYGNKSANLLSGGVTGSDKLFGFGGDDNLQAGQGADILVGGKGRDSLSSDATDNDVDQFVYNSPADSTVAKAGRDLIFGFENNFDRINVGAIDAIPGGSDNSFSFIGLNANFHGVSGELRAVWSDPNITTIQGDLDGDKKADFAIDVIDTNHSVVWSGSDFIL